MVENTFSVTMWDSWYEKRFPTTDSLGNTYWLYMRGVSYENGSADISMYKNCKEYPPPNPWSKSYYYYTDCISLGSATIKVGQTAEFDEGRCAVRVNSTGSGGANFTVIVDRVAVAPEVPVAPAPPPELKPEIVSYDIPSVQPQIDGLRGIVTVRNAGNISGSFRYILRDIDTGEETSSEFSLGPGETRQIFLARAIPCRDMHMYFAFEAMKNGVWSGPSFNFTVVPCYPSISIDSINVPKRARPGNRLNLSANLKNRDCVGIAKCDMWFGLLDEGEFYTTDSQRINTAETKTYRFTASMPGGEGIGKFIGTWIKCGEWVISEESGFSIYPEDCILIILPYRGGLRIISPLNKKYEFKGVILGENISSRGMERELGRERAQYFKGSVANESEAEITWDSLDYLRIDISPSILVVENKVILGEMDSYQYSSFKLPLVRGRALRHTLSRRISQRVKGVLRSTTHE